MLCKKKSILKPFLPSQECELTRSPSRLIHWESDTYLHIEIKIKTQNPETQQKIFRCCETGSWIELQIFNWPQKPTTQRTRKIDRAGFVCMNLEMSSGKRQPGDQRDMRTEEEKEEQSGSRHHTSPLWKQTNETLTSRRPLNEYWTLRRGLDGLSSFQRIHWILWRVWVTFSIMAMARAGPGAGFGRTNPYTCSLLNA